MAVIKITYPTEWTPQVVAALCAANGYQATIEGVPNPESADAFALRMIRDYVTGAVKVGNRELLVAGANTTADTQDDAIDAAFVPGYTA